MLKPLILLLTLFGCAAPGDENASYPDYLYKVQLVQAAPGELLTLIGAYQDYFAQLENLGGQRPFWMRHSQGDQWDLMLIWPMESYAAFYHPDHMAERTARVNEINTGGALDESFAGLIAWQEDLFALGPALGIVTETLSDAGFFHIEMFHALPGAFDALYQEREMENVYLRTLNRPENLIFIRDQGASWDIFTLGAYRDIKHYAESADIPADLEDEAARVAGFESAGHIGAYLRRFIADHHDTLAVAIR